jgi:ankyrin repeat protein
MLDDRLIADACATIAAGNRERLEALLAAVPSLAEARAPTGVSLLMLACYHRRPEFIDRLRTTRREALDIFEASALPDALELGLELLRDDPNAARAWSPDGFTPLHLAAFFDNTPMGRALLTAGADPDARARNAMLVRPLHSAAAGRATDIAELLLAAGADPNARQQSRYTAMHTAAQHGDLALIEMLLAHGADPHPAADDGSTPLDLAESHGQPAAAARLRAARNVPA